MDVKTDDEKPGGTPPAGMQQTEQEIKNLDPNAANFEAKLNALIEKVETWQSQQSSNKTDSGTANKLAEKMLERMFSRLEALETAQMSRMTPGTNTDRRQTPADRRSQKSEPGEQKPNSQRQESAPAAPARAPKKRF